MIITIDGPAGSGKSTAARNLAKALDIAFLDTGATYRAVTFCAMQRGVDMADEQAMAAVAQKMDLTMQPGPTGLRVICDGEDISQAIRSDEVSRNVHYAARPPVVRQVLVELQQRMGRELGSFVTEGRDQGSVVFPDADIKFFLLASPEIRAQRRVEQRQSEGESADYQAVLAAIVKRDESDTGRAVGPLVKPAGAIEVDTSPRTQDQTLAELLKHVEAGR